MRSEMEIREEIPKILEKAEGVLQSYSVITETMEEPEEEMQKLSLEKQMIEMEGKIRMLDWVYPEGLLFEKFVSLLRRYDIIQNDE